jgi:ATP/maltotriose-dependent transcriptional regulator MalT
LIARQLLKRFKSVGATTPAARQATVQACPPTAVGQVGDGASLSVRETEVLGLISKGFNFAEIARLLDVSPHTITAHVKKIYQKLAVHSRGEAVYEATRMGLL